MASSNLSIKPGEGAGRAARSLLLPGEQRRSIDASTQENTMPTVVLLVAT